MLMRQVTFERRDASNCPEGCVVSPGSGELALEQACRLLKTRSDAMSIALCERRITVGGESIRTSLSPPVASQARDAVSKAIYSRVFNHLVRCINRALSLPGSFPGSAPQSPRRPNCTPPAFAAEEEAAVIAAEAAEAAAEERAVAEAEIGVATEATDARPLVNANVAELSYESTGIPPSPLDNRTRARRDWPLNNVPRTCTGGIASPGVSCGREESSGPIIAGRLCCLDIFGFETFDTNGFEQLCINFANEKLQQLFITLVFTEQQREYAMEAIPWEPIAYDDNTMIVNLLEGQQGVFALLEEQCMLGKRGTDSEFCRSLVTRHSMHPNFIAKRHRARCPGEFTIAHYAGEVSYWCGGFFERNLDTLPGEAGQLLAASQEPLLQVLFRDLNADNMELSTPRRRSSTHSAAFKLQLNALMCRIEATRTHFIRCVNPNMMQKPRFFDGVHVGAQVAHATELPP